MRKLSCIVMALCSVMGAQAIEISESEAARIASEFVNSHAVSATRGDLKLTLAKNSQGYYAYNRGAGAGFVIVAADDAMGAQVLGYSASGSLDFDKLPCNLKWWLAQYDLMASTGASFPQASATRAEAKADVDTLLTCKWNQRTPYNNLCPEYAAGKRSATGCVATATAQVMYYHKWPEKGIDSSSYELNGQTLSMDFSDHVYDWEHMLDTYEDTSTDEVANDAVALLMRDCGYALKMEYGYESGADHTNVSKALVKNFGYDRGVKYGYRAYYTYDEWNDMLYKELSEKRPIIVGGGGHAFVFDGYKQEDGKDWYHVNWGWGGMSDGYFLCSSLNPRSLGVGAASGSYSNGLIATTGIQRPVEGSESVPTIYCEALEPTTAKNGGDVTFYVNITNVSVIDSVFTFGLKVVNKSTNEVTYVKNDTATTIGLFKSILELDMPLKNFPTAEGTYDVYLVYFVGDKEYSVHVRNDQPQFFKAEVKGDEVSFDYGEDFVFPTISDVKAIDEGPIYALSTFKVSATFTVEDKDYCGNFKMLLVDNLENPEDVFSTSDVVSIDLRKGENVNTTFSLEAPSEACTCYVILAGGNPNLIVKGNTPITITALPEDDLKWEASVNTGNPTDFDPATETLDLGFDLKCVSGYYKGSIYFVFSDDEATDPQTVYFKDVMLVEGQNLPYTVHMTPSLLPELEYGKTYKVTLGYMADGELQLIPSDATVTTIKSSGISGVNANGEPHTINIYSLGGKLVTTQKAAKPSLSTLPAGTYIVKIGDKAQKMVSDK